MKNTSFDTPKFDIVTAETVHYHNEIQKIKSITKSLHNALNFDLCDAIEKAKCKDIDLRTRKHLVESLLELQCAVVKSAAMLEQSVCLSIKKPF